MITKEAAQKAYQVGVKKALHDAGMLKQARMPWQEEPGSSWWPGIFGPVGGALAAPSGERAEGAVGSWLGAMGGSIAGGAGGAGLGGLASLAAKSPEAKAAIIAGLLGTGMIGGAGLGSAYGYRKALE